MKFEPWVSESCFSCRRAKGQIPDDELPSFPKWMSFLDGVSWDPICDVRCDAVTRWQSGQPGREPVMWARARHLGRVAEAARAELRHIGSVMGSRVGSGARERGVCHTRAKDTLWCILARKSSNSVKLWEQWYQWCESVCGRVWASLSGDLRLWH